MKTKIINIILRIFPSIKKDVIYLHHEGQRIMADTYLKTNPQRSLFFDVSGAGKIEISQSCYDHTGTSFGFSFGVQWGQYGFCGGVLDREEAKRLAEHILNEYQKVTASKKMEEQNYLKERNDRRIKNGFSR